MKEAWTNDPEKIREEIHTLIESKMPLSVYAENTAPGISTIRNTCTNNGQEYLILGKPENWGTTSYPIRFILYKPASQPARGFSFNIARESASQMAGAFPEEIFQIQRRRYPRIATPPPSQVTFLMQGRQRVSICRLLDISLGGAKIQGTPAYEVAQGQEVGPLTFKLALRHATITKELTIASAKVVRLLPLADKAVEMGISFDIPPDTGDDLNLYAEVRRTEDAASGLS